MPIKKLSGPGCAGISPLCDVQPLRSTDADKRTDAIFLVDGTPVHLILMDDLQGKQLTVQAAGSL